MAKAEKARVRLQIEGGSASPANVGASLGPHGVNGMEFCKQFNAKTADKKGSVVPVVVTVYVDRSFEFIIKTPLTSELIRKKAGVAKGSSNPKTQIVGTISWADVEEVANIKMADLNAVDIAQAKKIVAGSARSMGIKVE
jgi:large subunit ribosomal protein L11